MAVDVFITKSTNHYTTVFTATKIFSLHTFYTPRQNLRSFNTDRTALDYMLSAKKSKREGWREQLWANRSHIPCHRISFLKHSIFSASSIKAKWFAVSIVRNRTSQPKQWHKQVARQKKKKHKHTQPVNQAYANISGNINNKEKRTQFFQQQFEAKKWSACAQIIHCMTVST